MEKPLLLTVLISTFYFLLKIMESKYVTKESHALKHTVRDTLVVAGCVFVVLFLFFQMGGPIAELIGAGEYSGSPSTQAFTGEPEF